MGGNAFDAAVGGQAALAVTDFSLNGLGSDAVLLVYSAREQKVYSVNAEPRGAQAGHHRVVRESITVARFPRATVCSPAACRVWWTLGMPCSTAGAR